MIRKTKSWRQKLGDSRGLPRVEKIRGKLIFRWGAGTVAIPAPKEVDGIMRRVPKGKLITINQVRKAIAKKHHATIGCPITTGIFCWISAHAAEESRAEGTKRITPYWRTLKSSGQLNEKYPGGILSLKTLLEKEGHTVIQKGISYFVSDFEKKLVKRP